MSRYQHPDRIAARPALTRLAAALCAAWMAAPAAAIAAGEATLPAVTVSAAQDGADTAADGQPARNSRAAGKTDTPLAETPQSVSVVTRSQIEALQPRTVAEALGYTPGVFTASIGSSSRYDYLVLRGFNNHVNTNEWLDGLRLIGDPEASNALQVDPYFVERLDVVRGPDSVLYGQSSPGGLVAITTKQPLAESHHQIELSVGNHAQRSAAFDFGGQLDDEGRVSYRLVGKASSADMQQALSSSERYALMPSLAWKISSSTRLLLQAYLQNEPATGYHGSLPYSGSVVAHNGKWLSAGFDDGSPTDGMSRRQQLYGYQLEHDLNADWQFRQKFRYQKSQISSQQVYQTGWVSGSSDLMTRAASAGQEHGDAYSIDNQLEGHLSTGPVRHTLLAGLDYYRMQNDGYNRYGSASSIDPFAPSYASENIVFGSPVFFSHRSHQTGVYLQDQLAWNRWRLSLGARRDQAEVSSQTAGSSTRASWSGSKVTRRAGLLYLTDSGLAPYFNYSEGFDPNASYYTDNSGGVIKPLESRQKEVGIKYQPAGSDTLLSAAVYDLRQQNVAYYNALTLGYEPVGTVRSRGLELEARSRVGKKLTLSAGYTLNQMRITEGPQRDRTPFGVPNRMATLWADYALAAGIGLGAGIRHAGPSWADSANTIRLPSYTLVDLSLRFDLGRFDPSLKGVGLRLNANNLLDRSYVAACYDSSVYCYAGEKRNLSATVSYQW